MLASHWLNYSLTLIGQQVECWNKLDGNVGELSSWVATKDSAAPEGGSEISIEKLESQLNTLKTMFAEKQKLVSDLDAYGPAAGNTSVVLGGEGHWVVHYVKVEHYQSQRHLNSPRDD